MMLEKSSSASVRKYLVGKHCTDCACVVGGVDKWGTSIGMIKKDKPKGGVEYWIILRCSDVLCPLIKVISADDLSAEFGDVRKGGRY